MKKQGKAKPLSAVAMRDHGLNAAALLKDVEYLLPRAGAANRCIVSEERGCRDTGISSNALVRTAYGGKIPTEDEYPSDRGDLAACIRAWRKLPPHRQKSRVQVLLENYKQSIAKKWGESTVAEAIRIAARPRGLDE